MNDELLAMLLDFLISRQTAGHQDMGGNMPYDDYGMQGTIGGLGSYDGPVMEDWVDSGISGSGIGTGGNLESATRPYLPPPAMAGYSGGRPLSQGSPGIAQALAQLERGRTTSPTQGLFGAPPERPAATPEKERAAAPKPPQTQTMGRARPSAVSAARSIMQAGQGQRNAGTSYAGSRPSYPAPNPAPKPAPKPVTNPRPVTKQPQTYSGTTARNTLRQAVKR